MSISSLNTTTNTTSTATAASVLPPSIISANVDTIITTTTTPTSTNNINNNVTQLVKTNNKTSSDLFKIKVANIERPNKIMVLFILIFKICSFDLIFLKNNFRPRPEVTFNIV